MRKKHAAISRNQEEADKRYDQLHLFDDTALSGSQFKPPPAVVDLEINMMFKNKNILVTGGTGTVGCGLVEALLNYEPKVIRVFSNDEDGLFSLKSRLNNKKIRFLVGDVRDKERLLIAMEDIDIVFHMAALKHVLSCEYNPFEAVKTNVIGTQNVIDTAMHENVEKVIFTSSDKAVNPSNAMGTSKLMAERLITAANDYKGKRRTIFSSIRFGNVLGSNGSVVPLVIEQIRHGGPVTITHTEMIRFIMSISRAIDFIIEATRLAIGGEVFVMKMPAILVLDLIQVLIEEVGPKFGYAIDDLKIKEIGIKPGEKLFEELITPEEKTRSLILDDMFVVVPAIRDFLKNKIYEYPDQRKFTGEKYSSEEEVLMDKEALKEFLYNNNLV